LTRLGAKRLVMPESKPITQAMLTVPANLVPCLRSGVFGEWGFAAEDIADRALQFGSDASDDAYRVPLKAFDAGRALLDAVGWRAEGSQADVEIDLSLYPQLVLKALTSEQLALSDRLTELPPTGSKDARDVVIARSEALNAFLKLVKLQVRRLGRHCANHSSSIPSVIDPLQPRKGWSRVLRRRR
jgi:hypothetical protein